MILMLTVKAGRLIIEREKMDLNKIFAGIDEQCKPKEKKPIIVDRSTAECYATCPFQASLVTKNIKDYDSELSIIGTECHSIAERAVRQGFNERYNSDEMQTFTDDLIQQIAESRPDIQPDVINASKYLADQLCRVPIERILVDQEGKPFIEYQVDAELGKARDGTAIIVTARIDLAYAGLNSIHVIDWKFGYKKFTNTIAKSAYQTCHNSWILFQMFPDIETIHFWYYMPRMGLRAYTKLQRSEEAPSMPHLTTEDCLLYRINSAVTYLLENCKEAWPEEKKCLWCPVVTKCPHISTSLDDIPLEATALVDRIVVLTTLLNKHKKTATELYKKLGPLKGTNMLWEWKPTRRDPRLVKPEVKNIFEDEGEENGENTENGTGDG